MDKKQSNEKKLNDKQDKFYAEYFIKLLRIELKQTTIKLNQVTHQKDGLSAQLAKTESEKQNLQGTLAQIVQEKDDLASEISQIRQDKEIIVVQLNQKETELERVLKEKDDLFSRLLSRLQKSFDDYKALDAVKEQLASQLNQAISRKANIQAELEMVLQGKGYLSSRLDEIYSSDFWKVANFYYRIKERSSILRLIVHIASKFKRILSRRRAGINTAAADIPVKKDIASVANENEEQLTEKQNHTNSVTTDDVDFHKYYANLVLPEKNEKYDILFFSIIDWNFRFQRPQHIASRLARQGHRVFYLKTSLKAGNRYSIKEIAKNVYEVGLPYIEDSTIYSDNLENGINIITDALFNLMKQYSIKEHIYFVEFPMWYKSVKALKERFGAPVVFDVLDEFSGFGNVHKDISLYEKKMFNIADSVITSSALLYNKAKDHFEDCHLVKNGTDFKHFSCLEKNDLLEGIKKPIIGYYGAISDWFDTDLIEYTAKKHPEWSFVLIGHTFGAKINRLQKLDNVYFLGEKPYFELPKYLYWFDVCLIPFKDIPLIKSTNPVKFYEYISAGKPVVATRMDELMEFRNIAYIADGRDDFVKKIEVALKKGNRNDLVKKRKSVAKKNDWDKRVYEVRKILKNTFPKVSIVVVTYNNLGYTKLCLQSILEKTAYPNYEIIIVDNNSDDDTKDYLKNIDSDRIYIMFNDDNLGFAKANNIGIKKAQGDYIILLNNDTVVTRGWISGLLRYFGDSVGMVGAVTNSIGNEAKINVGYDSIDEMDAFAEYYINKHYGETFEIKMLAMFCVAIKREVIDKIGLLDERYGIGMFEDDDYAIAVKNAGYKLLCAEDVFIHHFGNATFKKMKNGKYMKLFNENRKKLEEKWKVKWTPHIYREGVI